MKIVVGLGNPGRKYGETRHNLGFAAVEEFSRRMRFSGAKEECRAFTERGRMRGDAVLVARPQTFMNRSGEAVECLLRMHGVVSSDLLVVCDDVAIDLGRIRLRTSGSDGGHLGLRSIIECLGTEDFPRLRIGIRTPATLEGDLAEAVLSRFLPEEVEAAAEQTTRAAECIRVILDRGIQTAMNIYNRRQPEDSPDSSAC